jgi:hypothetical protein
MNGRAKTNSELIKKNSALKQRIKELEYSEAEIKRAEQEMAVLSNIGRLIDSTLDIHEVYEQFAAEAKKLIPFDTLSINLYNFHENTLCTAYVSGLDINGRREKDICKIRGTA